MIYTFGSEFSTWKSLTTDRDVTVNIIIPYRYAGFLFANRITRSKFVIEGEREYYSDRDLSRRIFDENWRQWDDD